MKSHWLPSALLMLVFTWQVEAQGQTVYKVTDEEGRITYTDIPPESELNTETITLQPSIGTSGTDGQSLIDQMSATADRLKEDRLQREEKREQQATPPPVYGYPQSMEPEVHHYWYPYRDRYSDRDRWPRRHRREDDWHNKKDRRDDNRSKDRGSTWYVPLKKPPLGIPDPFDSRR